MFTIHRRYHGGGYALGLPEMNDAHNRRLADELKCVINRTAPVNGVTLPSHSFCFHSGPESVRGLRRRPEEAAGLLRTSWRSDGLLPRAMSMPSRTSLECGKVRVP